MAGHKYTYVHKSSAIINTLNSTSFQRFTIPNTAVNLLDLLELGWRVNPRTGVTPGAVGKDGCVSEILLDIDQML
jgi:hypothetical protein